MSGWPPEQDTDGPLAAPRSLWRRWYWPTVSLAAFLAFELTANPALSAILLCCHFGLEDWLTGIWLWRNDPHTGRGRACGWFSFARAVARTLIAAFLLLMLLVIVTTQVAKNQLRGPGNFPAGFLGIAALMMVGLPLGSLLSLIACLSARRHSVKVWLDPGLYASRRTGQWPVSIQGVQNLADLPYLLMISALLLVFLFPIIIAVVSLFPQNGPRPAFDMALVGTILAASLGMLSLLLRWTNQARARLPYECWEIETLTLPPPTSGDSDDGNDDEE